MTSHDTRWHDPQLRMAELNKQSLRLDSARRTHYKVVVQMQPDGHEMRGRCFASCQLLLCLQRAVLPEWYEVQRRAPKGGEKGGENGSAQAVWPLLLQGAQKHLKENVMQSDNVSAHATKEDENPELAGELHAAGCVHLACHEASAVPGAGRPALWA
jgi:hypothetical protein